MRSLEGKVVLLTGASGFIGSHLVKRLSEVNGIRLLLLSRQQQVSEQTHVQWLQGTLNDLTQQFWHRHGIARIDTVFHLGAFTPKTNNDANNVERIFSDNLDGTRILLEGLPAEVQKIIFSSTLDVYTPTKEGDSLAESSHTEPSGLYGASKLFCERLVSVWAVQHGCAFAILRYGHIFGPGEEAYGKLIPLVIRQLLDGQIPTVYGAGMAERDFLYVDDAVEATIRSANTDGDVGPVNIVRGESSPLRDIVRILVEKIMPGAGIHYLSDKPDGHSLRFDNSMMQQVLGTWPLVSLAEGLQKEITAFSILNNEQ